MGATGCSPGGSARSSGLGGARRGDGRDRAGASVLGLVVSVAFSIWAVGCAATPDLVPAPGAQPAPPGPGKGAVATAHGVTVIARSDAWSGFPPNLDRVTPILVTLENDSDRPIRIRYNEFTLVSPSTGTRYFAIPPFDIRGTEVEPVNTLGHSGFWVAPYYSRYYPGLRPYNGFFPPFDRLYYDQYYPTWVDIELPTGDMIQKALPEGVLDPGGRITGYLYFQNVKRDERVVEFTADLVTVTNGESLAVVRIPFQVE